MKSNELRIGNYLMGAKPVQVVSIIDENHVGLGGGDPYIVHCEKGNTCLDPIPLTEDWLIRFGLIYTCNHGRENKYGYIGEYSIYFDNENNIWFFEIGGASETERNEHTPIKYVHQLQNLYFALTGEELTLKQ